MKFLNKLFKRQQTESNLNDSESSNNVVFSEDIQMEKAGRIIVKATSLKDTNIGESIELIKKSISIFPDNSSYFKLANYLYDANRKEECYEIFTELTMKYDFNDFTSNKNMYRSEIFKKKAIIDYKEGNYKDYILNSGLSLYNWCIGLSIQGRIDELNFILESDDIAAHMTKTKLKKSFGQLEKLEEFDSFVQGFVSLLNKDSKIFTALATIYNKTDFNKHKDFEFNETVGEREDKILLRNQEFKNLYSMLSESKVEKFTNEII